MMQKKKTYLLLKRITDIVVSLVGLIFLFVPFLVFSGIVFIQSHASPIFRQLRVGRNGKSFYILKIRTMRRDAPRDCPTNQMEDLRGRLLPIGGFLRKYSLDEIPQLFNILVGDMSLVGPRPLILAEKEMHRLRMQNHVYSLRPGLTGLAQIRGRDNVSGRKKLEYDMEYVKHCSVRLDLNILWQTANQVFNKEYTVDVR